LPCSWNIRLLERTAEGELFPMAQEMGIGIMPWSPLKHGFLSGKFRRGKTPVQSIPSAPRWTFQARRIISSLTRSAPWPREVGANSRRRRAGMGVEPPRRRIDVDRRARPAGPSLRRTWLRSELMLTDAQNGSAQRGCRNQCSISRPTSTTIWRPRFGFPGTTIDGYNRAPRHPCCRRAQIATEPHADPATRMQSEGRHHVL